MNIIDPLTPDELTNPRKLLSRLLRPLFALAAMVEMMFAVVIEEPIARCMFAAFALVNLVLSWFF